MQPSDDGRLGVSRSADYVILGGVAAAVGAGCWMAFSTVMTVGDPVRYVFFPASKAVFVEGWLAAFVALGLVHAAIQHAGGVEGRPQTAFARVAYAAPLSLAGLGLLPLLILLDGPPRSAFVLAYLFVDLRPGIVLAIAAFFGVTLAARLGPMIRLRIPSLQGWVAYVSLGLALVAFALASSPNRRFESVIIGDEPRYLRYAESFYQGHGFDISEKVAFDDFPRGSVDRHRQVSLLVKGAGEALAGVMGDAVRWVRGEYRSRDVGPPSRNSFVKGRDGGVYQLHMPGLAVLLYPAYYIDRQYLSTQAGYGGEFPKELACTGAVVLALYVLLGMVTYRFVARYTNDALLSWTLSLAVLLTIPVAPFNLQYYPEVTAAIILIVLLHAVLFAPEQNLASACGHGLLAGFLPWLHLRFLPVSLILAGAHLWRLRRAGKSAAAFTAIYALSFALLALYFYDVTGSVLPTSMYALSVHGRLDLPGLPTGFAGLLLDRRYGILPYAPVYFAMLPGVWLFVIRRWRQTFLISLVAGTLTLLSSAYVPWTGGSSTPARFLVAAMPFASLPLAHAFERFGRGPLFRVLVALLLVISIDNAFVYLSHIDGRVLIMSDESFSGWKTTLLFPAFAGRPRGDVWPKWLQVAFWAGTVAALLVLPWWRASRPRTTAAPASPWRYCALVTAVVLILAVAGGALTQPPAGYDPRLRPRPAPTAR